MNITLDPFEGWLANVFRVIEETGRRITFTKRQTEELQKLWHEGKSSVEAAEKVLTFNI